jgi:N-acetylglucosamine kinase-like BadF-type ATPase
MSDYVIGIDGGNSKTDVVIASTSGRLLARTRGPGVSSPLADPPGWRHEITSLVDVARQKANIASDSRAACAAYFLANVDLPSERRIAQRELDSAHRADLTVVQNDALAVLRAGATRPWGVAVVAGAGINAVGLHPSGRIARFLALGDYSGDAGGGHSLGLAGLSGAVRARDGRGPATVLATVVPEHYGLRRPEDVAVAVHRGDISYHGLRELAPVVLEAAATGDPVAMTIIATLGTEVSVMANALIKRLRLGRTDVEVILGGGILQAGNAALFEQVRDGILAQAPRASVRVLGVSPVYGAIVEAFSRIGAADSQLLQLHSALLAPAA